MSDGFEGLRLGPDGYSKIALLGTQPASVELAPFDDPSWAIWACSPGCYPICAKKRSDVWFEPHRWLPSQPGKSGEAGTRPWFSPEFHQFLREHKGPVFMTLKQPDIPSSVEIPYRDLVATYGPYFWTSTLAYMIAMAIEALKPRRERDEKVAIGLFGIDMSASEEYAYQRPGCQHFVGVAKAMGIDIVLPLESDLMRPTTMYGIGEHSHRHIKLRERLVARQAAKAQAVQQARAFEVTAMQCDAAIGELQYMLEMWSDDVEHDITQAVSFAGVEKQVSTGAAVVEMKKDAA